MQTMPIRKLWHLRRSSGSIRSIWYASVLLGCVLLTPAFGVSINVPLDHWSYRELETLYGFGLMPTLMLGTKPFTRDEFARLIVEALPRREALPPTQRRVAGRLLGRLWRTFREEVRALQGQKVASTFLKPLDEVSVHYAQLDGEPRRMLPATGIDATEGTPMLRNNEGIVYEQGGNMALTASAYAKLWDHLAFYVQPLVILQSIGDDTDADVRLHKGYAKGQLGPIELEVGRDTVWWGQGFHGTLLFSNNARPLEFVKVSNPHPARLPWIFKYLGLVKGAFFFAQLEADRDVSRAKLFGGRLQFKPFPWVELGAVTGVQFDGEGMPGLGAGDILDMFTFNSPSNANQLIALDLRLTLPFLRYTQLYIEYGGEDSGGPFSGHEVLFGDIAYLVGLYVPRLTDDGRTTFRFEWMQNTYANDSTPGVWYANSQYRSGFTFKRLILGHATGGDSGEFFWRVTRDLTDAATLGADFAYRWRGDVLLNNAEITGRAKERSYGGGLDLHYFVTNTWEIRTRFAAETIKNFDLQRGVDRTQFLFLVNVRYHFPGGRL
jgi:hypothetical protein